MRENISNERLSEIVKKSISWSSLIKNCGANVGGASYQYYQGRVKKLGFDTSHFLGQSAHSGDRHTGTSKKKHWSEVLILRKTSDRERSNKFHRAYTEYCKDKKITIECVDCSNSGLWLEKKLQLEINHKNECRWDNRPNKLEWV